MYDSLSCCAGSVFFFFFFCFPQYPPPELPDMDGLHSTTLKQGPYMYECTNDHISCMSILHCLLGTTMSSITVPSSWKLGKAIIYYNKQSNNHKKAIMQLPYIRAKVKYLPTSDSHHLVSKKPHLHLGTYTTYLMKKKKRRPVRLLLFPRFDDDLAVDHPLDHPLLPTFCSETGHQRTR